MWLGGPANQLPGRTCNHPTGSSTAVHSRPQELDLKTYSKVVCTLLDIPVYDDPIESLHVLFTLYLEFKNNPVFRQHMELENRLDAAAGGQGGSAEAGGANVLSF